MNKKEQKYFDEKLKRACQIYLEEEFPEMVKDFETAEHHEFSDRFYKNMNKAIEKESIKPKRKLNTILKVAAVITIFISIGVYKGAENTEAFKVKFIQTIVKKYSDHRDSQSITENFNYDLNVMPKSWEFIYISKKMPVGLDLKEMYTEDNKVIMYFKASDKYVEFSQTKDLDNKFEIEDYNTAEEIAIKKFIGTYYETDKENVFIWTNNLYNFQIKSNFTKDEIIDIGTNLKLLSDRE